MELHKLEPKEVVVGIICDMCNQSCASPLEEDKDFCYEHGTLSASWGFYSDGKDLTHEECHLCEKCFGKVRDFITSNGGKVREIEMTGFGCTAPHWHMRKDLDYKLLPGMFIRPYIKDKVMNEWEDIKKTEMEYTKKKQEMDKQEENWEKIEKALTEAYKKLPYINTNHMTKFEECIQQNEFELALSMLLDVGQATRPTELFWDKINEARKLMDLPPI